VPDPNEWPSYGWCDAIADEDVSDEEAATADATVGVHVPDDDGKARTVQNLELSPHGMELVRRLDIVDQLRNIDVPTLVCVGELEPVTPLGALRLWPPCRMASDACTSSPGPDTSPRRARWPT
jgi:hypothetical protein